jgi:hypothetical protein
MGILPDCGQLFMGPKAGWIRTATQEKFYSIFMKIRVTLTVDDDG